MPVIARDILRNWDIDGFLIPPDTRMVIGTPAITQAMEAESGAAQYGHCLITALY
jgi:hypothetical protein